MNVLIITHAYAPDPTPRAFRWTAIAEHWAREGAAVDVVTTGRRGGAAMERRNGVTIHHVGETVLGRMHRRAGAAAGRRGGRPGLRRMLRWVYDATWRRVFWPDYACLWRRPALAQAKRLCRSRSFDAVITVSHPFSGHMVGLSLKRALPGLRWIADMGDPFSLADTVASNNAALYRRRNRRAEAAVLRECDAVSVTVEGCRTVLADTFAVDPAKIAVIPPLLSLPEPESAAPAPEFAEKETVDLVYLGVLYPSLRPPDALLDLFAGMHARCARLRLHFFGDVRGCEAAFARHQALMGRAIHLHGPIPRAAVAPTMAAADILVNIGNGTAHQLPSKLVEYVAAGKPILNIAQSRTDTAAAFLDGHPASLTVTPGDGLSASDRIDRALDFVRRPVRISAATRAALIAPFGVPAIATAFARLVLKGPQAPETPPGNPDDSTAMIAP